VADNGVSCLSMLFVGEDHMIDIFKFSNCCRIAAPHLPSGS
jgi:hypothetical protein